MVLPLPLVPFEELMLLDDRPAYPMNLFFRLRFQGVVDRGALAAAMTTVLPRHPLLTAIIRPAKRGSWNWVSSDLPRESVIRWAENPGEGYPHMPGIDLRTEIGVRLWVQARADSTDFVFQWHHACCDGLGALVFVKDLLASYARQTGVSFKRNALRRLDEEQLHKRGEFGMTTGKLLAMAHRQALGIFGTIQFYGRKAVAVIPHEPRLTDLQAPAEYPTALTHDFTEEESAAHLVAARQLGATTNDLFCRDLFLALSDWRAKWQVGTPKDWLRLGVPMNMRTVADRRMPAANVVSNVFLDRRERDFGDAATLLKSITWETQLIKRNQLGLTFVLLSRLARRLPGGLKGMARADRCVATCLLTNLGEPLANSQLPEREGRLIVGDLTVEGMDCLGPLRPNTVAAMALSRYAGRQSICLHYEPRALTAEQAQELLAMYAARVRETIQPYLGVSDPQETDVDAAAQHG